MALALNIHEPTKHPKIIMKGMILIGNALNVWLNPSTRDEVDWIKDLFVMYLENRLKKANGIITGIPQQ